jgi:hypothetical protein
MSGVLLSSGFYGDVIQYYCTHVILLYLCSSVKEGGGKSCGMGIKEKSMLDAGELTYGVNASVFLGVGEVVS